MTETVCASREDPRIVRAGASVAKQETIKPTPALLEYVDLGSGETNGTITPDNIGTINGHRLKFDPTEPAEGIFFIADDNSETKATAIQKNKPGQLVFLVPTLASGTYHLEVRAIFGKETQPRTGRLEEELTVAGGP